METKKKALIITYYWPPSGGSGVQRWLKFAKYLPLYGWEPVIYTPENPEANTEDPTLAKDIAPGTKVIKRKIWEPYSIFKMLSRKKDISSDGGKHIKANLIGSNNNSLSHKLSLFVRGNFFIPDPRRFWIRPSVKFLSKYVRENHINVIISTGPPHSMHLIAKGVKEATGVRWIADFRDPWTEIFYFKHLNLTKWAYRRHRNLEQGVLDTADTVVVVNNQVQRDFAARTSTPVAVITNGFDHQDIEPSAEPHDYSKFSLLHTGIFVDNGNPEHLWETLGEKAASDPQFMEDLQIRLMGQVDSTILQGIEKAGLTEKLINMGYRPHKEVVQWQRKAQVLLMPLRKEPEAGAILAGKFFEYIASGRPVLAFGPTRGVVADALEETGGGVIVDFSDKESTRKEIDRLYTEYLQAKAAAQTGASTGNNTLSGGKIELSPAVMKYSRQHLTGEMVKLFEQI